MARPTTTNPVGTTGIRIYGTQLYSVENNPSLVGREKYRTFSEMVANTAIIGAGVRYFLNLLAKAKWRVHPRNDSAESKQRAEWFTQVMEDMDTPWPRVVKRAALYKFYGFSIQEWTARRDELGNLSLADVSPRPQATICDWQIDPHGKVTGVWQEDPNSFKKYFLPRRKIVYIVDDALDTQPDGLGLFRHVAWTASRLKRLEELESLGYETDLRGIPVIKAPLARINQLVEENKLTPEDARNLIAPLEEFAQNHIRNAKMGLMIDSAVHTSSDEAETPIDSPMWMIELLKGSGNNSLSEVATAIKRLNYEAARALGVEHLMLGSDGRGSFALSRDKSITFSIVVDGTLTEIAESFTDDLLTPLWLINGWDHGTRPRLRADVTQFRDIETITGALNDLAKSGVTLSRLDESVGEVFDQLGLSRLDPTIEVGEVLPDEEEEAEKKDEGDEDDA